MYCKVNFKTKKELKQAVARGFKLGVFAPGLGTPKAEGTEFLEGPHYPEPHRWYAQVKMRGGLIVAVKCSRNVPRPTRNVVSGLTARGPMMAGQKEDKMKCPACKHDDMRVLPDVSTDDEYVYRCYYCGRIVRQHMAKVICMDCEKVYNRIPSATITETHGICDVCLAMRRMELSLT